MKRRIKLRKRKKYKLLFIKLIVLIFLFLSSFCFSMKYFINNIDTNRFIKLLLKSNNSYFENNTNNNFFIDIIKLFTNINISKPNTLLSIDSIYIDNKTSSDDVKDIDSIPESNYIKDPYDTTNIVNPIIYLYNTHQSEEYSTNQLESYNIKPTVMMASYILREKLNKNGISTIVEENDVTEFLRTNNWNYASSYKVTKLLMEDAYSKNNTLTYFIDLHRDSVSKNISTINIDNKNYAKVLFIVGLENSNYKYNLDLTEKLNNLLEEDYPGITRGIYKKQGKGVNGIYNQDFNPNTILIEIGGSYNTIDEVYNTCEAISVVLTKYIKGDISE